MSTQVARRQKWFVLFCSLAVVVAAGCAARTPARSFPDLQQRLSPGVTVHVTDSTGTETRGTVIEVSPSGLTLVVDGVPRHMEQEVVSQVQTCGDPLWNGLLVGMAVGTAGALISDPTYAPCPNNAQMQCANSHVGQRVLEIGVMGGVGAGIDALIRRHRQVYLAPERAAGTPRVTVAPQVGASTVAIFITLGIP